jgi:hypothetical protein
MAPSSTNWQVAPIFGVRDVLKTVEYFQQTLGFDFGPQAIEKGVGDEGAVYAVGRRAGISIHIQIRRRPLHFEARGRHESDAFVYVDDVDALYEELLARGARLHRGVQDEPYGIPDFTIETPDGHRIAFGAPMRG